MALKKFGEFKRLHAVVYAVITENSINIAMYRNILSV